MNYDSELLLWPRMKEEASNVYINSDELVKKLAIGDKLYDGKIDTWDYQWAIIKAFSGGINVIPSFNLIQNIGFGFDATHTNVANKNLPVINLSLAFEENISGPCFAINDHVYDQAYAKVHFKNIRTWRKALRKALANFPLLGL